MRDGEKAFFMIVVAVIFLGFTALFAVLNQLQNEVSAAISGWLSMFFAIRYGILEARHPKQPEAQE